MKLASSNIDLIPNAGYLLAEFISANKTDGGILLPASAAADYKKLIVASDPSGTYVPGTEIFAQEGIATPPHPSGRVFWWVKLDLIYGYRA